MSAIFPPHGQRYGAANKTSGPSARTQRPADDQGFFAYHGLWAPGVRAFRQMRFGTKAWVISLIMVLPMILTIAWLLVNDSRNALDARKNSIRQHIEAVYSVLEYAHNAEKSGAMSREQAQSMVVEMIKKMRYDGKEYFWINDMEPRMIVHPIKPELDGKPLADMKDPNGVHLFNAFVDQVKKNGQGFVSYQWPRPGSTEAIDKISYVKGFEAWGWIIGTGVYVDDVQSHFRQLWIQAGSIVSVALLIALYLFVSFYKVMKGGLQETGRHLKAMSKGDLTTSPKPWGTDEAADLMLELHNMQEAIRKMVYQVRNSSDEILHSSSEIASGALDLSARTEQAAANLEESASAMEEISSTVGKTTENTESAAKLAQENSQKALHGGAVMQEVVQTMNNIRTSSEKISEIIGTIDGIAFQTNILALNAAVESARAGEHGRGFAVVAGEVRNLAQRSSEAAREIKTLIGQSVEQVQVGTQVVSKAGEMIHQIVNSSKHVKELITEIDSGAREQNLGIGQIGLAVQELDKATQQNAAMVEQTAAAASAMRSQAAELSECVSRFALPHNYAQTHHLNHDNSIHSQFDFDSAIEAHRQWKVRLRKAISEHQQLDVNTICKDDQCALGKWLHGSGNQSWSHSPTFVELVNKHAEFHQSAGEAARMINSGRMDEAERLIGSGSAFAKNSTEVAALLTRAKRGL